MDWSSIWVGGWLAVAAGLVALLAVTVNLPTRLWMRAEKATLQYLGATTLQRLDGSEEKFQVRKI